MTSPVADRRRRRSPEASRLLAAYREHSDYDDARADATWDAIGRRLDAGDVQSFEALPEIPTEAVRPSGRRWAFAAGLAAAAALGVAWLSASGPDRATAVDSEPPPQASFESRARAAGPAHTRAVPAPRPPEHAAQAAPDPAPPELPSSVEDTPAVSSKPASRRAAAERREPTPSPHEVLGPSAMERELALLRRAQLALGRSAPSEALDALQAHAEAFPRGALAPEREGLRAIARCELGDPSGPAEGARFIAAHPRSTLRARVQNACARKNDDAPENAARNRARPDK